jgi:transcriptional regulator with XRE-family HTH domain
MTGAELRDWRKAKGLTQESLGQAIGCTHPTVNRWEKGRDIPEPVQKLLRLYMFGEHPFKKTPAAVRNMGAMPLTLEEWSQLEAARISSGCATVEEYLVDVVRKHLRSKRSTKGKS